MRAAWISVHVVLALTLGAEAGVVKYEFTATQEFAYGTQESVDLTGWISWDGDVLSGLPSQGYNPWTGQTVYSSSEPLFEYEVNVPGHAVPYGTSMPGIGTPGWHLAYVADGTWPFLDSNLDAIVFQPDYSSLGASFYFVYAPGTLEDGLIRAELPDATPVGFFVHLIDTPGYPMFRLGSWDATVFTLAKVPTVNAVPLPPAALTGLGLLCLLGTARRSGRRAP